MSQEIHSYKTIAKESVGFYKEKGSKFYAYAIPCTSEQEIKNHIARLRKENHLACHVCSAFRLGHDKKIYRSSDDGEPNNSAGPPILGQIQSFDLTNILIAVVRFYGGTNLGVGGLITAYKTASKEALEGAEIIEKKVMQQFEIHFDYSLMPDLMKLIKQSSSEILSQELSDFGKIIFKLPLENMQFINDFQKLNSKKFIDYGIN